MTCLRSGRVLRRSRSLVWSFSSVADAFVQCGGAGAGDGACTGVASSELERVLTAAIKLYAAKAEAEEQFPAPVSAEKVTPTEIVLVVSEIAACGRHQPVRFGDVVSPRRAA